MKGEKAENQTGKPHNAEKDQRLEERGGEVKAGGGGGGEI